MEFKKKSIDDMMRGKAEREENCPTAASIV